MYYGYIVNKAGVGKRKKADLAGLMLDFKCSGEDIMRIMNPDYYESRHYAHSSLYRAAKDAGLNYGFRNGGLYIWKP